MNKKVYIISFGYLNPEGSGGGLFSWFLSDEFVKRGFNVELIIFSKGRCLTKFKSYSPIPLSRILDYSLGKFTKLVHIPGYINRGLRERIFDFFSSVCLKNSAKFLIATHPVIPLTLERAKKKNIKTILIAPVPHNLFVSKVVFEEMLRYGIKSSDGYTSDFRLTKIQASYTNVEFIICTNSVAYYTFAKYEENKKIRNLNFPMGINFGKFKNPIEREDNVFRVCYISHTVILKGLQYLLEAWQKIDNKNIELIIGSNIDNNVMEIIKQKFRKLKKVKYTGYLKDMNSFYKNSSIGVFPSLIDNGPSTVFEAMACGLPVIVTEGCGAKDIIEDGKEGFVLPIRDAQAIKEKIIWFYEHPKEREQMGLNAEEKIKNYTIEKFAEKVVEAIGGISNEN